MRRLFEAFAPHVSVPVFLQSVMLFQDIESNESKRIQPFRASSDS
jgi:hypothetical protein